LEALGDPERRDAAERRVRGAADMDLRLLLDVVDELRAQRAREGCRSEDDHVGGAAEGGRERREVDRLELVAEAERLRERGQLEVADLIGALRRPELLLDRDEPAVDLRRGPLVEHLEHPRDEAIDAIL